MLNSTLKLFFTAAVALSITACSSKNKKPELPAEVDYLKSKDASIVLSQGYNRGAVFSDEGDKIFYISRDRKGHKNTQIHEYDLTLQADRRLTFQDGDVFSVIPLNEEQIIYASNTDEIKEQPFAGESNKTYPKAELYLSDLYGSDISRLTNSVGFDGEMIQVPVRKSLLFTSTRSGTPGLFWLDLQTDKIQVFAHDKVKPQRSAALSFDGKSLYWIEEDPSAKSNAIVTSDLSGKKRKVVLTLKGAVNSLLSARSGLIIYSWQPQGADYSHLDIFDPEKVCTQTLLKTKLNFSEPQFSIKNPSLILVRVSNNDKSQVYRWQMPVDLGPCNEQGPSDTLKR